ncbi:MAG: T9SS type A sorting domain-containing protein [Bacteroidota bacterium]
MGLKIWVIRRSDGSGADTGGDYFKNFFAQLDRAFAPHDIYFLLSCIEYINDTNIYESVSGLSEAGAFVNDGQYHETDLMNLYIHGGWSNIGVAGTPSNWAFSGVGQTYPGDDAYYSVAIHELGHALSLRHTHYGNGAPRDLDAAAGTPDLVDGSTCCSAGDFVCDTPPDPLIRASSAVGNGFGADIGCTWLPGTTADFLDDNGDQYVNVDVANYMSYYRDLCPFDRHFSPGQGNRMRHHLANNFGASLIVRPKALIHQNEFVTSDEDFDTDVRILSGNTLALFNCTHTFRPGTKIQVDAGARLQGIFATLTANADFCDSFDPFWSGIELSNVDGTNVVFPSQRAVVYFNGCNISQSENGIHYASTTFPGTNLTGALFLSNSNFVNNRVGLNLANGAIGDDPRNEEWHDAVSNCSFVVDASYPGGTIIPYTSAIKLGQSNPIFLDGNKFTAPGHQFGIGFRPAIDVFNTRISVKTLFQGDPNFEERTVISNYEDGIRLESSVGSLIENVDFINGITAVTAANSPNTFIVDCDIDNNTNNPSLGYAVQLTNSPYYFITDNNFIGNTQPATIASSAIQIVNCGQDDAFISSNTFTGFNDGVVTSFFDNGSTSPNDPTGARISCNEFDNVNQNGLPGPYDVYVFPGASIAPIQGSTFNPAGNIFVPDPGSEPNSDFNNQGLIPSIDYYYSSAPGQMNSEPLFTDGIMKIETPENPDCLSLVEVDLEEDNTAILAAAQVELYELEQDLAGAQTEGEKQTIREKISDLKANMNAFLFSLELAIEQDSTTSTKRQDLQTFSAYHKAGFMRDFRESILDNRYGDFSLFSSKTNQLSMPSHYGQASLNGFQGYKALVQKLGVVVSEDRNIFELSSTEMTWLNNLGQSSDHFGPSLARSILDIYYDIEVQPQALREYVSNPEMTNLPADELDLSGSNALDLVHVFPNPVQNGLVQLQNIPEMTDVQILDLNGRVVQTYLTVDHTLNIDISQYRAGVYIFRMVHGTDQRTIRLIVN